MPRLVRSCKVICNVRLPISVIYIATMATLQLTPILVSVLCHLATLARMPHLLNHYMMLRKLKSECCVTDFCLYSSVYSATKCSVSR